jgi:hypothetical protein
MGRSVAARDPHVPLQVPRPLGGVCLENEDRALSDRFDGDLDLLRDITPVQPSEMLGATEAPGLDLEKGDAFIASH